MIELPNLILFITAGVMLNLTPGPDMIYGATRSLSQGRAAGVVSALGIAGGRSGAYPVGRGTGLAGKAVG